MKGKIWKQLLSVFCVMLLLMTSSGVVALADDMQGEIVVTEDSLETECEGEYSDELKQDMQENFEDVSLASIPEDDGISVPLSQEDDNALMADESDSMEIEEDILAEEEIEESLVGALESSGNSTIDSFINDSRFTAGVYWPGDKTPVLSPFTSWGCCAYCADYVKYCYGINNPRAGISSFTDVNETRQGDVLTLGNQSDGTGHWFVCLKRSGNKLYVAEGSVGNYKDRVRIGWNYTISGSKFAESNLRFTAGYHFMDSVTPPTNPTNNLGDTFYAYTIKDYGDNFYAYIIANGDGQWRHIANINNNVAIPEWNDSSDPKQTWHFIRQGDYSYKVINEYDGALLDADWGVGVGANVQCWSVDTGGDNQRWYIATTSNGAVTLISKQSDCALDCTNASFSSGTNIQMYEINNTVAQSFCIYNLTNDGINYSKPDLPDKVTPNEARGCLQSVPITLSWSDAGLKSAMFDNREYDVRVYKDGNCVKSVFGITGTSLDVSLDDPGDYYYNVASVNNKYHWWNRISDNKSFTVYEVKKDYGDDFYAYIIVNGSDSWKHIAAIDSNVQIADGNDSQDPRQIWHFVSQSDNSYKIWNAYDGYALDADSNVLTGGSNVQTWWESHDRDNQKWYIVSVGTTGVALVSRLTQMAIDCTGGSLSAGTNIQLWPINGTAAQSFAVYNVKDDKIQYEKPGKPSKVTISVMGEKETGKTVTVKWTESPLIGQYDKRIYNVEVYKDGTRLDDKSKNGLTAREMKLPVELGKYSIKVRAVNARYKDWYTDSDTLEFTVEKATPKLAFASSTVSKKMMDAPFTNTLSKTTDGIVTFKSSNTNVATVNSNSGQVTIKGVGTATITASATAGTNYKAGSASYTLTVTDGRTDLSKCTVTLSATSYTYNGSAKKPTVTVKNGSSDLTSGTDYTVAYTNNTNAGTATVTVTGQGSYKGTVSKTFTINQAAPKLTFASSTVSKTTLDPVFTNTLTKTTDGTVTFKSSNTAVAAVNSASGAVTIKGIGTATITVTAAAGKNYKAGSASYTLTVIDGRTDLSKCTVTLSATSYTYNAKAKKPTVTVKNGTVTLTSDTDYTVAYSNNTNAGTATVTVTGIGNCTGTNSATFLINKAAPKLTFASKSVTKAISDDAFINELTKTTDGTVTLSSSNTNVATVNSTSGIVTIRGAGTATITATAAAGKNYKAGSASYTLDVSGISIEKASIAGVSLSYGYSGKAYTPAMTVKVDGVVLAEGKDYTVQIENNKDPGTATITLTGIGNYTGTRIKTFEIVDCVSSLVSGKTYQMIPKNNSSTAVCAYSGRMLKNTKVYITDRSASEAMRFKAIQNSDGTWKFINAKCEMALAVQQNSSALGAGIVLYDQTTKTAQNWNLSKKSDNSWAIMNAVTGYSIAMSDESAVKGTTLSMAETQSNGLQRFYIAETDPVDASFDGTYFIRAAKDKNYVVNIAGATKEDGANVNLNGYSNTNSKKFKAIYSGAGYYRLVNVNSGLVLSVEGNTKKDGTNVLQSEWAAQSGQRWKFTKNSDGTVTLTNALGTNLHLTSNKTASGTNIVAKNASTSTAQKWYLQ